MTPLSFVLICLADLTEPRDVGVEQRYIIEERLQVPVREADHVSDVRPTSSSLLCSSPHD